jgi:DNA-binding transcriptional regulator LsrR (DeoR family)
MTTLTSIEELELLQTQRLFMTVKTLAEQAKATFVGISQIDGNAPLHQDGFINDDEVTQLIELGAVGEIAGWADDRQGVLIQCVTNSRVAGVPLEQPAQRLIIGIAGGVKKSGVNFGGSAWEVDRTTGRRRSCRPSYS